MRPVVGDLCHVIYADEDEAKVRHGGSRRHHFKYPPETAWPGDRLRSSNAALSFQEEMKLAS